MTGGEAYSNRWEWLDEIPDEWEPPSELLQPSSTIEYNLAIKMLAWDFLGREFCAAVGRFIVESSLFKIWYSQDVKGSERPLKEQALLALAAWEHTHRCYDAWQVLVEQAEANDRNFRAQGVQNAFLHLKSVLDEAAEQLQELRLGTQGTSE